MKRLLLGIMSMMLALAASAIDKEYVYTQISQNEGLTATVNCIYKEKDGDVWIGTPTGLYSFNGYSLRHCGAQTFGSRKVYQVGTDMNGGLWALTEKHVLKRKVGSENFEIIQPADTLVQKPFYCMLPDDEGVWIGGMGKLYRYSDKQLRHFCTIAEDFDLRHIEAINDSTLLCCSNNGKVLVNIRTKDITSSPFGTLNEVSATLTDSKGRIWLAIYNKGIEVYEKDGTQICSYNTSNSNLSNNIVLCMDQRDSVVLAGTDGGGINLIDIDSGNITTLKHIPGDRSSFPAHSIKSIHVDQYNNIWAGSIRNGLINISQSDIISYRDTHIGLTNGLSNPTVMCTHQGRTSDYIWIGTDGEGLNRFDPKTSKFTHYRSTLGKKIVSIADYSENELVLSVFADNVWIFNKITGNLRPLPINDPTFLYKIRHSGRNLNIINENDGDLLFFANSIYRYNEETGLCHVITDNSKGKYNFGIIGRNEAGVWLHNNVNIYLLEDNSGQIIFKGKHESGDIRCGHLGSDGVIYLATDEGICLFDTATRTFRHIRTQLFTDANCIVCDNNGRAWVGTELGLAAYIIESDSFTLFDESDGVDQNEFLPEPHLRASNGDVYMGGVYGLLRIKNGYNLDASDTPSLKLNELMVDGEDLETLPSVYKVPRRSKKIVFGVTALEKDIFRHRMYRFSLSDNLEYKTSVPMLSLRQMPKPGTYHIAVSCTKRNGEWTEPFKIMTLVVPYPWYLTWWFIGSCILLLIAIYFTAIYSLNARKEHKLKIAMQEQEQKVYEEKVNMLINVSHELRTPLTLIMAPLKRVLKDMQTDDENYPTLSRIHRQSRRMKNLLDMVLDLRRLEAGGSRLKREEVDYNRWVAENTDDIVNEEKADGISIVYKFSKAVSTAKIDKQKCDIVLMNILINAIKHSNSGDTITISTELTEEGYIRTSISDEGPGLGADVDIEKIFNQFYQSNSEKYGSGIGLSYSKILVEMHGGRIGVENNAERGATFWWDIPTQADNISDEIEARAYLNELLGHSSEASSLSSADESFNTKGMRLMLIDDNKDLLDFLKEALSQDFAEIITMTGGKAALTEMMHGKLPDIIVSDVNMPDGDGFWLCNQLKSNDKLSHIPFVLLTARGEDQSQCESYKLGADGFLAKPFDVETLMELIRGLLKRRSEIRKKYLDKEEVSQEYYGSDEERFIIQLNQIIAENISNPALDQQLICRELGVSRALLYNRMKAITGGGTKEYITRIRIERAKALMESTSLTIAEISDMTGFASQSYFSTAFKNYTDMTPSQYKQNHKSGCTA